MKIFVFIIIEAFKTLQIFWKVDYFREEDIRAELVMSICGAIENIFSPTLSVWTANLKIFPLLTHVTTGQLIWFSNKMRQASEYLVQRIIDSPSFLCEFKLTQVKWIHKRRNLCQQRAVFFSSILSVSLVLLNMNLNYSTRS